MRLSKVFVTLPLWSNDVSHPILEIEAHTDFDSATPGLQPTDPADLKRNQSLEAQHEFKKERTRAEVV
jgi:hypothetical protein